MHAAGDAYARKKEHKDHDEDRGPPVMAPMLQPMQLQPMQMQDYAPPPRPSMSRDAAARTIQNRYGGRVLAVQPDGEGYRVKMLKDGEVRIYQINP